MSGQLEARAPTRWMAWALVFGFAATLAHHVYGGLAYRTPERLVIALVMTLVLFATLITMRHFRVRRSRRALAPFVGFTLLVWVLVLGAFEGGYNHAYKDLLFLAGVSPEVALRLPPNLMPGDYIYPPNDIFFEITGVLQFAAALFVLFSLARLIQSSPAAGSDNLSNHEPHQRTPEIQVE